MNAYVYVKPTRVSSRETLFKATAIWAVRGSPSKITAHGETKINSKSSATRNLLGSTKIMPFNVQKRLDKAHHAYTVDLQQYTDKEVFI